MWSRCHKQISEIENFLSLHQCNSPLSNLPTVVTSLYESLVKLLFYQKTESLLVLTPKSPRGFKNNLLKYFSSHQIVHFSFYPSPVGIPFDFWWALFLFKLVSTLSKGLSSFKHNYQGRNWVVNSIKFHLNVTIVSHLC